MEEVFIGAMEEIYGSHLWGKSKVGVYVMSYREGLWRRSLEGVYEGELWRRTIKEV